MPSRRVCLFACHERSERIVPATFRYIEQLAAAGFAVHVACSGFETIDGEDREALASCGATAHPRPNAGLDFGAWHELIARGVADGASELLLANDSVFGPFAPLAPIFAAMAGFDAWGMVMSREGRPHLQSWFVAMTGDAFRRPAVQRVLSQNFAAMTKEEIIVHGELGLGAAFAAEGLDVGARYRARFGLRPSQLVASNPMHFRWREMLREGSVPFLKRELVRDNPARIVGLGSWPREVRRLSAAPLPDPGAPRGQAEAAGLRSTLLQLAMRENRLAVVGDMAHGWWANRHGKS